MLYSYLAALALLPVVMGMQECYVCVGGEGSREVEHQFPREHLPMCHRGVQPPAKQCPPRYKGCLTQYNGERVTRMCGELGLTVCQEANNVKYCYCQGQLCNKEDRPSLPESESESEDGGGGEGAGGGGGTSDDEDLNEGSGTGGDTILAGPSTESHHYQPAPISTTKPIVQASNAVQHKITSLILITIIIFPLKVLLP